MSPLTLSVIALACILAGTVVGMLLRNKLPEDHLGSDAKDLLKLGAGLIGTIAALVLGLPIASAKTSFDTQVTQVKQLTADVILLDQLLAQYGPEAAAVRNLLRGAVECRFPAYRYVALLRRCNSVKVRVECRRHLARTGRGSRMDNVRFRPIADLPCTRNPQDAMPASDSKRTPSGHLRQHS